MPAVILPTLDRESQPQGEEPDLLAMLRTLATSKSELARSARWCIAAVFCGICVALLGVAITNPSEPLRRVAAFEYSSHFDDVTAATHETPFALPTTGLPPGALAAGDLAARMVARPSVPVARPTMASPPPRAATAATKRLPARAPAAKAVRPSRPR